MKQPNMDLRLYARGKNVSLWEVAQLLKVGDATLYRWLNINTSDDFRKTFTETVDTLAKAGG